MKKALNILFSSKLTLILLLIFAIGTGVATFIEDKLDTISAHTFVYNAKWFEVLMLLLVINFIGNIKKYNLLSKQRFFGFIFHAAFILLILGAGVTRYFGFGGSMHIREGQSSNIIMSTETYLQVKSNKNPLTDKVYYPLELSENAHASFNFNMKMDDKSELKFAFKDYIPNATETVIENVQGGSDMLELRVVKDNAVMITHIKEGEAKNVGKYDLAFNNNSNPNAIHITKKDGALYIQSSYDIIQTNMQETDADAILKDSIKQFKENSIYKGDGIMFAFSKEFKNAKMNWTPAKEGEMGVNVLLVDVSLKDKNIEVPVFCNDPSLVEFQKATLDGIGFSMGWGQKEIKLPFSIYLDDFILDTYPGSMNPSSYKSEVTLVDSTNNLNEKHSIFMNNVLDYKGYRFFQSAFDNDQKGTILSVNHDFWGTWISYLGYMLICVGAFLTLLNKNSRFTSLRSGIKNMRSKRKAAILTSLFVVGISGFGFSQDKPHNPISAEHADKFGHLIVQTFDGRFEPMHTLAYDVMHKISRKDHFDIESKGKMNAMQVFLDMLVDQKFWTNEKIIYIREKAVKDALGVKDYISYNEMFDMNAGYKIGKFIQDAFKKKPSEQNAFDKEIIKLDERANICRMVFEGSMLKIFPIDDSKSLTWVQANDTLAFYPLKASLKGINEDLQLPIFNYTNLAQAYFLRLAEGISTGNYAKADKMIEYFDNIQRQSNAATDIPSKSKVDLEIFYNKAKIFENLRNVYAVLSLLLLSLAFYENLSVKKNNIVKWILNGLIALLGVAFLYHTFGIALRWYLSGHAPWSNGYEALLIVSWGGLLAGFYFWRYSKITLASTAVLAFAILMTAGHSSYDTQLTNLQPVLKSYWLVLHVAVITISYGFLGLGFMLGLINMFLYIFKNYKNALRIDYLIAELTKINEMNLEIGLFLATIGTFLGGVWANESWGRYWGWDAKETWALVIIVVYACILHLRLVPKLKDAYIFNVGSIVGFGSVIMTFVGVNYYLSKGLHSYASGDSQVFPVWAWVMILLVLIVIISAGLNQRYLKKE
ncbi:MAG: cytochrome c biogenesis protein CcsA [Bacteroidota bacterium]